jgi:hypothetical protein
MSFLFRLSTQSAFYSTEVLSLVSEWPLLDKYYNRICSWPAVTGKQPDLGECVCILLEIVPRFTVMLFLHDSRLVPLGFLIITLVVAALPILKQMYLWSDKDASSLSLRSNQ